MGISGIDRMISKTVKVLTCTLYLVCGISGGGHDNKKNNIIYIYISDECPFPKKSVPPQTQMVKTLFSGAPNHHNPIRNDLNSVVGVPQYLLFSFWG